jgi:hypothetical protein
MTRRKENIGRKRQPAGKKEDGADGKKHINKIIRLKGILKTTSKDDILTRSNGNLKAKIRRPKAKTN